MKGSVGERLYERLDKFIKKIFTVDFDYVCPQFRQLNWKAKYYVWDVAINGVAIQQQNSMSYLKLPCSNVIQSKNSLMLQLEF